jgi:phosphoenolpyruvate carboxykinase (ATP)
MVRHPYAYGEMLKARLLKHDITCWLVNTGWTGGPFGVGKRIGIRHTRALLDAALTAKLKTVEYRTDPVFGFEVPVAFEGIPKQILDPASAWPSREAYDRKYRALAARFIENFKLIKEGCPDNVADAGPARVPGV